LITRPSPRIRITVPRDSTAPESKSIAGHVIAAVSPIRNPVAIMSTKSTKSSSGSILVGRQLGPQIPHLLQFERMSGLRLPANSGGVPDRITVQRITPRTETNA
jgi:hypothetical protein